LKKCNNGKEGPSLVKLPPLKENQQHYKPEKVIVHDINNKTQDTIFLVA
jgi:hypothetical protein